MVHSTVGKDLPLRSLVVEQYVESRILVGLCSLVVSTIIKTNEVRLCPKQTWSSRSFKVMRFEGHSNFSSFSDESDKHTYLTTLFWWSTLSCWNLFPARISASKGGLTRTATLILSFLLPPVFKLRMLSPVYSRLPLNGFPKIVVLIYKIFL